MSYLKYYLIRIYLVLLLSMLFVFVFIAGCKPKPTIISFPIAVTPIPLSSISPPSQVHKPSDLFEELESWSNKGWTNILRETGEYDMNGDSVVILDERKIPWIYKENLNLAANYLWEAVRREIKPEGVYPVQSGEIQTFTDGDGLRFLGFDLSNINDVNRDNYPLQVEKRYTPIAIIDNEDTLIGFGVPVILYYRYYPVEDRMSDDGNVERIPFFIIVPRNTPVILIFYYFNNAGAFPQEYGSLAQELAPFIFLGFPDNMDPQEYNTFIDFRIFDNSLLELDRNERSEIVSRIIQSQSPYALINVFWGAFFFR